MTAKLRKQILLGLLGAVLLYFAGDWLLESALKGPLDKRNRYIVYLDGEIQKRETALEQARTAGKQLEAWAAQSLPSDIEVARSQYRTWLLELVVDEDVDLNNPFVDSGEPFNRQGLYRTISFSVRGSGTLQQLKNFLFKFYSTNYLHQIRSLNITPLQKSDWLDLMITIETVVLPGANRQEWLAPGWSDRLASLSQADYESVVRRNIFGVGGNPDPTDYAFLTTVVHVDGQPEAWFTLRANDEILKLRKGQSLEVGQFSGTLTQIENSDVVLESDGERWLLAIGENLAQAYALPPEF